MIKKILLITAFAISPVGVFAAGFNYLDAPNATNRNFSAIYQQQFEKEESLDFINNPEDYKTKREQKDQYLDYKEGKTDIPSFLKPKINTDNYVPAAETMQFTKGADGQIKIQGIK